MSRNRSFDLSKKVELEAQPHAVGNVMRSTRLVYRKGRRALLLAGALSHLAEELVPRCKDGMPGVPDDGQIEARPGVRVFSHRLDKPLPTMELRMRYLLLVNCVDVSLWEWDVPRNTIEASLREWIREDPGRSDPKHLLCLTKDQLLDAMVSHAPPQAVPHPISPMMRRASEGKGSWRDSFDNLGSEAEAATLDEGARAPMLGERLRLVKEMARLVVCEYGGEALNLLRAAQGSAVQFVDLITQRLPGFRDESQYNGRIICFYARAQRLAGDVYYAMNMTGPAAFTDMTELTAPATERISCELRALDVVEFAPCLEKATKFNTLVAGSSEEIELRSCTVQAMRVLTDEMRQLWPDAAINDYLVAELLLSSFNIKEYKGPRHTCKTAHY